MMLALFMALLLDTGDASLPWYILLPLAIAIPIGVLVVFSRIKPRGGGH